MDGTTQSAGTGSYTLPLPSGWEDRTAVTITGPVDDGVQANVVVTRESLCDHMGLGAFAEGWVARLSDQVPVTEIGEVEHVRIDGRRGQIRTVGWQAAGLDITQLVGLVTDGEDAYAIVCTASADAFGGLEEAFRGTIAGFRLSRPASEHDEE